MTKLQHLEPIFSEYKLKAKDVKILLADFPANTKFTNNERSGWKNYGNDLLDYGFEGQNVGSKDVDEAIALIEKFIKRFGAVYTFFGLSREANSSEVRSLIRTALYFLFPNRYPFYKAYAVSPDFDGWYTNPFFNLLEKI